MTFNAYGVWAIYRFEMARALRTLWQSVVTPVITTALYFVVFGGATLFFHNPTSWTRARAPCESRCRSSESATTRRIASARSVAS